MDESADDISERPPVVATGSRRRRFWLIVVGALVFGAGAGAVTTFFLLRGDEDTASRPWVPPAAESPIGGSNEYLSETAIQKYCLDRGGRQTVVAYFSGDNPDRAMRQVAEALGEDDRIAWVKTETRQEAYQRFKEIFVDQPELVELARPEALPASVTLLPAEGVYPGDLANAITDEFSAIESLSAGCEFPE
jgi:hypothetical protein